MASPEPVVGWRLWRLEDGLLRSLVIEHAWVPGENVARCLARGHLGCPEPPGRHCLCGMWAVWSPRQCLVRAWPAIDPPWQVMGLVAGWGTVALHGGEGFRAQRAAVLCLFSDRLWPWSPPLLMRLRTAWRRVTGPDPRAARLLDRPRQDALRPVADRYAVPLLSVRDAVDQGLLAEFGIPAVQITEALHVADAGW